MYLLTVSILREQRGSEHALVNTNMLKGALSDLKQFLVTGSPLKFMKNAFYFTLKPFLFS